MTTGDPALERKLAAILYTDVAEYSRLTEVDEEGTHRALTAALDAVSRTVARHGGRVLHYAGDAVLAEFPSAIVAVQCALALQGSLVQDEQLWVGEQRLRLRIGVNLGDVIADREELYGEGVNVAARLESIAPPGGICISGKVHAEVRTKVDQALGRPGLAALQEPSPSRCTCTRARWVARHHFRPSIQAIL